MAVPHPDAVVVRGDCFVASRFPYPVLNNAVILDAPALDAVREVYGAEPYAVWSETTDEEFATRPDARRRGFGSRVVRAALRDALNDGYLTASLQAMPLAEPMYIRVGFRSVGQWQEWVPT